MKDFDDRLLLIYGSLIFGVSLFVFYIIFKGFMLISGRNIIDSDYKNTFYIIASLMVIGYVLFISIVIFLIMKGREEDLKLQSIDKYINWRFG